MTEPSLVSSESSFGRLKHALNSLEGREKYRAHTNSPSDGDDVRWYFSKVPLPLQVVAAASSMAEVVGKSDFLRFSMNDSLSLEAAFLKEEEELVSAWWKEYAECSEGPLGDSNKGQQSNIIEPVKGTETENSPSKAESEILQQLKEAEHHESDEVVGVSVKGGLYEVDLYRRRCFPIYWTGDHRRVLRGHWFAQKGGLDWLPLREDVSEQLEFAYRSQIWHRRTFQPSGKFAARVNLQSSLEGLHALFSGEDDTWEAWLGLDSSGISSILGFKGLGIKLRRGFAPSQSPQPTQDELRQRKEEKMDDYCSQVPVRHLIFMVHGIGQRLENSNFVDDVGTFRLTTRALGEQHLTTYQLDSLRVLFIPCQWRRGLKLGGEEAVETCTLEGVRALRTMLSATVHDVLYYMSPVYCQDIIDTLSGQLNMLYRKFIKRNPGYNGKVSIFGHSLGSVLSFDILCHQKRLTSSFPLSQLHENSFDADSLRRMIEHNSVSAESGQNIDEPLTESCQGQEFHKHETTDIEIDNLKNEIARLKEKLAMHEEVYNGSKRQVDDGWKHSESNSELNQSQYVQGVLEQLPERNTKNSKGPGSMTKKDGELVKQDCTSPTTSDSFKQANTQKSLLEPSSRSRKTYTPYIEYTKLAFEVDTFFAVGSPIGVFLSLRNIRLGIGNGKGYWEDDGIDEEMPACKRLFNIFHPFDPVAYRIEPLICKEYIPEQPVFVPYHRGGRRLHIGMQEFGKEMSARSRAFVQSIGVAGDRVAKVFSSAQQEQEKEVAEKPKERTYGSFMVEKLTGDPNGRIDFMLQDATFEHQYLQAISSHTAYWQDPDTALLILKHLYADVPEEDPELEAKQGSPNAESVDNSVSPEPALFLDQNNVDDDLAFTFSHSDSLTPTRTDLTEGI